MTPLPPTVRYRPHSLKGHLSKVFLWLWGRLPIPGGLRWLLMWLGNQKFMVGVGAIIFNDQGQVLLFHHTYRNKYPWGLPGGWLQRNEDPARAIEREILEESGLVAHTLRPVWASVDPDYAGLYLTFAARLEAGEIRPGEFRLSAEVSEARFFDCDSLPCLMPEQKEIIQEMLNAGSG